MVFTDLLVLTFLKFCLLQLMIGQRSFWTKYQEKEIKLLIWSLKTKYHKTTENQIKILLCKTFLFSLLFFFLFQFSEIFFRDERKKYIYSKYCRKRFTKDYVDDGNDSQYDINSKSLESKQCELLFSFFLLSFF